MQDTYKTVEIEGDDRIHIISGYEAEKDRIEYMLCGVSTNRRRPPNKIITEVNENPTCPRCVEVCLRTLNQAKSNISSARIISEAYRQLFGINACRKGKCDELHHDIAKTSHNFPYIPNNCKDIAGHLSEAFYYITRKRDKYKKQLRFLDVGCGIGNIVTLASAAGFIARGIELNEEYLKIARRLTICMDRKPYFECADIITFDKYHLYDLIYYYVPIKSPYLQTAFEVHLIKGMKVGAFMLPTGSRKAAIAAEKEHYLKNHTTTDYDRSIFEKVKEVPKDWIPKVNWLRKEYRKYVASKQTEKGGKN